MKNIFTLIFLLSIIVLKVPAQQSAGTFKYNSKVFIENNGQITDGHGNPNNSVLFLYHDGLFNLELKESGFSYEIFEVQRDNHSLSESGKQNHDDQSEPETRIQSHRIDLTFDGANQNVIPRAEDACKEYFNFISAPVSTNRQLQVQGFRKIVYENLYDGIDLVFYAPDHAVETQNFASLRYEFIVHPGADLSRIKFRYDGATDFLLTGKGDFLLHTSLGFIQETKPKYLITGNDQEVDGNFLLKKNIKSFSAFNYDHSKTLIIDPNIIWGTYFGGEKVDEIAEVSIGPDLQPVIDGHTLSFNHIATSGAYQQGFAGGQYDWFIAKFNNDGALQWSTYYGGNDKDYCYALAVDADNNIIASGNSESQGLATEGAFQDSIYGTKGDILLAKFSPQGNLIWATYMGGEDAENVRNIVTDAAGDLYVAGVTSSTTNIASTGAHQDSLGGYDDGLLAKFTAGGNRVWSTYYGDSGVDRFHVLSLDMYGHVYAGGTCTSVAGIASAGAHQTVYGGDSADAFLVKFDTNGVFDWGTYYGGARVDRTRGVETDSAGNVYLGGFTNSEDAIATPGSFQDQWYPGNDGGTPTDDVYLVKFNSDGVRQWGTYLGGAHNEDLWGMTIDKKINAIYLAGETNSGTNIAHGNAMQPVKSGGVDCLFAKFFTDGSIDWSTYFGGLIGDQFEDVAVDQNSFVYAAARATGKDMITTPHAYQTIFYGGASDAMLYKFYGGDDCYDPFEPNETLATAKTIYPYLTTDTTVYGYVANIRNSNDHDCYTFTVSDTAPNIMATINDYAVNLDLNLYNGVGILIYQSTNIDSIPDTISVNGLSVGDYYLEIPHASDAFDSVRCYRLQLFQSDTLFPLIGIPTFILENKTPQKFLVNPNPAVDYVTVNLISQQSASSEIIICDLLNRIVYQSSINLHEGQQQFSIPVSYLENGAYQLVIQNNREFFQQRFVKQ